MAATAKAFEVWTAGDVAPLALNHVSEVAHVLGTELSSTSLKLHLLHPGCLSPQAPRFCVPLFLYLPWKFQDILNCKEVLDPHPLHPWPPVLSTCVTLIWSFLTTPQLSSISQRRFCQMLSCILDMDAWHHVYHVASVGILCAKKIFKAAHFFAESLGSWPSTRCLPNRWPRQKVDRWHGYKIM